MEEADFWVALEYRICTELAGFADARLRHYWCDGLLPDEYDLRATQPCIRGLAYCGPSGQERWRFTLLIGESVESRDGVDWAALLPAEHMTGWLSPHPRERTLHVDPRSAHPE